eukprot:5204635-Prymnesium_polylepis.1
MVPPECQPGGFFRHLDHRSNFIKRSSTWAIDGTFVSSKDVSLDPMWECESAPIGPVPDPRPQTMVIKVWSRAPRASEKEEGGEEGGGGRGEAHPDAEFLDGCAEELKAMMDDDDDDDYEEDGDEEDAAA